MKNKKKYWATILSLFFLLTVWLIVAHITKSSLIFPSLSDVIQNALDLCKNSDLWVSLFFTSIRSIISFVISLIFSFVFGYLMYKFSIIKDFMKLPLTIIKVTPVVSFILIAVFWISTNSIPYFISVIMIFPILTSTFYTAFVSVNKNLLEMSILYNFSKKQRIKYIFLPTIISMSKAGIINGFGQTWKVVLASEVLCLPRNAIGSSLYIAKTHFNTTEVFALTFFVILVSFLFEELLNFFFYLWEKKHG